MGRYKINKGQYMTMYFKPHSVASKKIRRHQVGFKDWNSVTVLDISTYFQNAQPEDWRGYKKDVVSYSL